MYAAFVCSSFRLSPQHFSQNLSSSILYETKLAKFRFIPRRLSVLPDLLGVSVQCGQRYILSLAFVQPETGSWNYAKRLLQSDRLQNMLKLKILVPTETDRKLRCNHVSQLVSEAHSSSHPNSTKSSSLSYSFSSTSSIDSSS